MNSVSIFVKSLVTLTFMWCIAENILPEKSIKKYSSYIYGLIIISMTISVFTYVDFDDFRIEIALLFLRDDFLKLQRKQSSKELQ